jgi:hypothetical protein
MRFFRREVEVTLKGLGVIGLLILTVLPVAWGYEQRQQARLWRNVACTYRIREVERRAPMFVGVGQTPDACRTLRRLGLEMDISR